MVWLLNTVQALAAGVCGSGQCCCTKNTVSVQISVKALAPCGQQECTISSNKDVQKTDMTLPFVVRTSDGAQEGLLEYTSIYTASLSPSFEMSSLHLRPPLFETHLYIQYHQFLI
ncbi:MAG: hypothetical protein HYY61_06800 [Deltaproteobacteria bacterium]|nr:hypothetical protein [Deltaproteobacteria bacterium]